MSGDASAPTSVQGTVLDDEVPGLARVYGEALLNAAEKAGPVEEILDELDAIASDVFRDNPGFVAFLTAPSRPPSEKDRALVQTFEGRADPTTVRFLRVLNRHGRLVHLGAIARAARAAWDRRRSRTMVVVRSAVPLTDAEADALRARLSEMIGGEAVLRRELDASLIGGLIVQVGDDLYDASVRNRLEQLRQRLIEGKTHEIQSRRDHFRHPE